MKVLFLCHRFPLPAEGGGKIRALYIVRHLAGQGHDVTLCSPIRSGDEAREVETLRSIGVQVVVERVVERMQALRMVLRVPTGTPSSFGYFYSERLSRDVARLLEAEHWHLVLVHCSSMAPYVLVAPGAPKVLDFADMDSQKWLDYARHKRAPLSWMYALEGRKLAAEEVRLARRFDFSTTVSPGELATLEALAPGSRAGWFPNGVDTVYFAPLEKPYDRGLIVFVGRMDYYPNAEAMGWFCSAVWPRLKARRADLMLRIVGANPPRAVRRLAAIDGVEVTGTVPDVRPHVGAAALSIAPLRIARGMQNKVLECMAMGVPVVTTRLVRQGLGVSDGAPIRVADTAGEYVDAVLSLLADDDERSRLASASRAFVEARFTWPIAMARLDSILRSVARARSEPDEERIASATGPRG